MSEESAYSGRFVQAEGTRGSLKWIQRAIEERWPTLERPILERVEGGDSIEWRSPIRNDGFAEYRDAAFLHQVGAERLADQLASFWPRRGPQWDALGMANGRYPILVEAKAHIPEFCTPGTSAIGTSRSSIRQSLDSVAEALGAKSGRDWTETFYQYANRLAHLWFLRENNIPAYLVLVGFVGDHEMKGPETAEAWDAAYTLADYALGLPRKHKLSRYVVHVHPRVSSE